MRPVRVGVVGVGAMGYHHARIYYELSKQGLVELVGVADIDQVRARRVAEDFHTKPYTDPRDLLRAGVEAVSIAVPTSLHRDIALLFLENGVHVLVEKPIADTVEKAKEIIETARRNNLVLLVGHVERFNPAVNMLKDIIEEGTIGQPITMSAKRVGPFVKRVTDTGVIVDLAVHDIDVMSFLINDLPVEVYARARNIRHPSGMEDYALIMLTFSNHVDGVIETNRLTPYKARILTIVGTDGIAQLDYIEQDLVIYDDRFIKKARIQREEPLKRELLHFIRCVQGLERPLVSGEDGLRALRVAQAAVESYRRGEIIRVRW